jgi:hypothetical protein
MENIGRFLILSGVFLVIFGLILTFWHRIPLLGRLPGDILISKGNFQLYFPLVTCFTISAVLTIIFNIILSLFR